MAIGAPHEDEASSNAGAVYIFERNEGGADTWGEVTKITASDAEDDDEFGASVSIALNTLIVGAPSEGVPARGAAYIFYRNEGGTDSWGEVAKLVASAIDNEQKFGTAVSIAQGVAAVGAPFETTGTKVGSVYVFDRDKGGADTWGEAARLVPDNGNSGDRFGSSVSVLGNTVVAGSEFGEAAHVFDRNAGGPNSWGQVQTLIPSDKHSGQGFGRSVAYTSGVPLFTETVVVGASADNGEASKAGAGYVFEQSPVLSVLDVPTLGQWGLLILALAIISLGFTMLRST